MSDKSHYTNPLEGSVLPLLPEDIRPDLSIIPLNPDYLRRDGREPEQIREIKAHLNPLPKKNYLGSSLLFFGNTIVTTNVVGPKLSTARRPSSTDYLNCKCIILPHVKYDTRRTISHKIDSDEIYLCQMVARALTAVVPPEFKESSFLDMQMTVISDDGCIDSALINSASLSLALSGINMFDMVVACTVLSFGEDHLVDPSYTEIQALKHQEIPFSLLTVCCAVNLDKICHFSVRGAGLPAPLLQEAMRIGQEACKKIYASLKDIIVTSFDQ
jgi:ribonuclease PH